MKTNRIFLALSVATALLCASCSNDDETLVPAPAADGVEWKSIPFEATVSDGDGMRATLDSKNKYVFEAGDKLIVAGENIKGELTLKSGDEGKSSGVTFEGELEYTGGEPTAETALTATLVGTSDGIHTVTDKAVTATSYASTLCATRAEAVQKLSDFQGSSTYGDRNFSLSQKTAFLDFTITMEDGTAKDTEVAVSVKSNGSEIASGTVKTATSDSKVVTRFIAGVKGGTTLTNAIVQLDSRTALSIADSKELTANKFYNVARTQTVVTYPDGKLPGQFQVNASGTKVFFSQGNLQYIGSAATPYWQFADRQYDYLGTTTGQDSADADKDRDLFGWGTSGWNNGNAFYQPYSTSNTTSGLYTSSNGFGYGPTSGGAYDLSLTGDYANADWGVYNAISNGGNAADLWRTLTTDEWVYVFNTRTTTTTNMPTGTDSGTARYTKATVADVSGVILFPDNYAHPAGATVTVSSAAYNTTSSAYTTFTVDASNWEKMESSGAVFLPAAGYRTGTSVYDAGSTGYYWSSTAYGPDYAYFVYFSSGYLYPQSSNLRYYGYSVRLVRQVE